MLTIRLQRAGKSNRPEFRIILAEKTAAADKKFVEILGHYNPRTKDFGVKEDRVSYWINQHVELSPTIHNLFVTKNLLDKKKVKEFSTPAKPVEPVENTPTAPVAEVVTSDAEPATAEAAKPDAPQEPVAEEAITDTPVESNDSATPTA